LNELRSLWAATAPPGPAPGELSGSRHADVAIIGAGYTGLAAALRLSAAGRSVIVLEALQVGEGASGLNGGQVIPGVKHDPDVLESMLGPQRGPRLVKLVASGPDVVFGLIHKHNIACDATRNGWLQPATSQAALQAIGARVAQWRARGADVSVLSDEEMARLTGSHRYLGGWIDRRGGTVQPLAYVRGLAAAALQAGVQLCTASPVVKLHNRGGQWHCTTPRGEITSTQVIVATNAYTDRLLDPLRRSLIPVPSFQVATEPLTERLRAEILPQGQAASDTWHLLRYFRVDASGRLVMGTRGTFGTAPVPVMARHHYRAVREIFPQLAQVRYEYHWGGLVAMTRDHLPHLHEIAPGLITGLGYNGRGVAMATVMGGVLADRLLGAAPAELDFPMTTLVPVPLHRFSQLGARLAVQGYRTLDALTRLRERLSAPAGTAKRSYQ
jgi:glycine/D-amino acid oxidase-like deaminating enzyme